MALININNLSFTYEGDSEEIFSGVCLQLDTAWRLGFVGRNGRGKTTFLRLLMGQVAHTGTIVAPVRFSYFPPVAADPNAPAGHALGQGVEDWRLLREIELLGLDPALLERPWRTLSGGEATKLQLAAMFTREDGFPLIDEPTNHLDREGRAALSRYLAKKQGYILVSHDRAFLDGCVDHILSLNRTGVEVQRGNFSSFLENRRRQDAFEQAQNRRLSAEIAQLEAAARSARSFAAKAEKEKKSGKNAAGLRPDKGHLGRKSARLAARAVSIAGRKETMAAERAGLLHNVEEAPDLKMPSLVFHAKRVAALEEVAVEYDGRRVCGPLTLAIERGERVALEGKNGSGKTSLLRLLCGEAVPHTGTVALNPQLRVSYLPQNTGFLRGNVQEWAKSLHIDVSLFLAILRKLDFPRGQFTRDMADYSDGQRKKVLLAASLCTPAHLYVWDEPLNYVDIYSRMQIETLLLEYAPTLLFVEHDAAFCARVATRTVHL